MRKTVLPAVIAASLAMTGCADFDGMTGHRAGLFAGIGGAGCGLAASALGRGGSGARALRGLFAGGACAAIGGAIGHALDERDRQRMAVATAQALQQRLPPQYYRPGFQAASYQTASGYGGAAPAGRSPSRGRASGRSDSAPASDADAAPAAPAGSGRFPGLAPVKGAQWVSDHSGASGSVQVISAEKPRDGHGECRNVVQTVSQPGTAPASEEAKFCESRPGAADWTKI